MTEAGAGARIDSKPEPWLRGTLTVLPAEQRAVLHALELAREDMEHWCGPLSEGELNARPHGLPPVAFHLRHIVGSLDRLLTYAENGALSVEQKRWMANEMEGAAEDAGSRAVLLAQFHAGLTRAEERVRRIDPARWAEPRGVGRKQLPTTVAGLMVHCADHTQRHVGQAITTAKILLAMRSSATA